MLTTIIVFGVKVYIWKKVFDAIENVGKDIHDNIKEKLQTKKASNEQFIETYFVD